MIDLDKEKPVTLKEAVFLIPEIVGHPRIHQRTIYNWATKGKRGILLETVSIGGLLVTTKESFDRFFENLANARQQRCIDRRELREHPECETLRRRTVRCRSKAHKEAMRKLAEEHGIVCNGYKQEANETH